MDSIDQSKMDELFNLVVEQLGHNDLNEILYNWNESELSEDGNEILIYVDSRSDGPRTGGASKVDPKEFIDWLSGEGPFDTETYGEDIKQDADWVGLIEKARSAIRSNT